MKRTVTALSLVALLVCAGPAAADSISFTKDNNVWVAAPDGSNVHQITHDGSAVIPYRSPSMDDGGVIVAGHGNEIVRMRQTGEVLSHFDPPAAVDSTGDAIDGVPQNIAVSPDGTRIAFNYATYTCPPAVDCGARQVLLYSYADHATPVATFGEQFNLRNPSWIDNARVLEFGGHFRQVNIDTPGGANDDAAHWFEDPGNEDLGDGELSRAGDRFAVVRSYDVNTHIAVMSVDGGPGGDVELACLTGKDRTLSSPSWSPDGHALAFAHAEGIEVLPLPNVVPGDCPGAASSQLVIPGGQEPDWSPAAVDPKAGSFTPGPVSGGGDQTSTQPSQRMRVRAPKSVRLSALIRKGFTIRVNGASPGRVVARATLGKRLVGSGSARLRKAGSVAVRVRLSRAGARYVRHHRTAKLTVRVTFKPAGGRTTNTKATIRVAR